jgi:hypothetical protein
MPITKEELQERAQLVRVLEASCKIDYPTVDEANFRLAVMKRIGLAYRLRDMRAVDITGPVKQTPAPPQPQQYSPRPGPKANPQPTTHNPPAKR